MSVFATEGLLEGPDTVQRGVRGQRGAGVASRSSVGAALAQSWVMLETEYLTVTRAAYDTIASDYARVLDGALDRMSWDRAVLCTFAELVARDRLGPVADVGRDGADHRLPAPPRARCRRHRPVPRDAGGGSAGAARAVLRRGFDDCARPARRQLRRRGRLVLADPHRAVGRPRCPYRARSGAGSRRAAAARFPGGDQRRHLEQAFGHAISLDAYRMQPDQLAQQLDAVGMAVYARVVRAPEDPETSRRRTSWPASPQSPLLRAQRSAPATPVGDRLTATTAR